MRRVGEHLVCTVFDLMLAQYGWPGPAARRLAHRYDDLSQPAPCLAGADHRRSAAQAIRIANEFARNAEEPAAGR